jgi:hypothetical protein
VAADRKSSKLVNCHYCDTPINLFKLNWRKSACFTRSCIVIANIYEAEAIPDVQLLSRLKDETGFGWKYSYILNP